jgi:hypothetical protein
MSTSPKDRLPKKVKLRLTFQCIEYHTIERKMPRDEFYKLPIYAVIDALDKRFRDVLMPDVDVETVSWELHKWEIVK